LIIPRGEVDFSAQLYPHLRDDLAELFEIDAALQRHMNA
jgi:hypothetical protein